MSQKIKNYKLAGYGISPGAGMGKTFIYRDVLQHRQEVYYIGANEVETEYQRIEEAFDAVRGRLQKNEKEVERKLNEDFAGILRSHVEILSDSSLLQEIYETIKRSCVNAEFVVLAVFRRLEARFRHADDNRLAERADDIADLTRQVLRALTGQVSHRLANLPENTIVVASQLLPSDTVYFSRRAVSGVIVERGGQTSHAAILTRELDIPAVSIDNAVQQIAQGENVIVDGTEGTVFVNPDEIMQEKFHKKQDEMSVSFAIAKQYAFERARTRDGIEVDVMANISCREDAELAIKNGADGVGLYRTEHLYFGRDELPSEDELLEALEKTLAPFDTNTSVTLRLLDVGGDKLLPFLNHTNISEPLMGLRGVRFLLKFPDLLFTQLRSFLRLSLSRSVRVLVPMVTVESDMHAVREFYTQAANDLSCQQLPPLGSMIETPASALCAESITEYSDFLNTGTNDLTQYTMAASRENAEVADYFIHDHPSIFCLLQGVAQATNGKSVGICGQLAGQASVTEKLLAMGVHELSVNPRQIPYIKKTVQDINVDEVKTIS